MVKRPPLKAYLYTCFALIVLFMNWESNLASAALLSPTIPEESIRIRILANSDSAQDQWVKKQVQEAITASINSWNQTYTTIEDARLDVERHLPDLNQVVGAVLSQYGFTYGHQVELGQVAFPAKVFGKETYPAGQYEALRVTLGEGRGENWWCVLFPPLCFGGGTVKAKAAAAAKPEQVVEAIAKAKPSTASLDTKAEKVEKVDESKEVNQKNEAEEVEARFFLVDVFKKIGSFFKGLF
jgi:stage II sporulation protein R